MKGTSNLIIKLGKHGMIDNTPLFCGNVFTEDIHSIAEKYALRYLNENGDFLYYVYSLPHQKRCRNTISYSDLCYSPRHINEWEIDDNMQYKIKGVNK